MKIVSKSGETIAISEQPKKTFNRQNDKIKCQISFAEVYPLSAAESAVSLKSFASTTES